MRQDGGSSNGFFETIQGYFQGFGNFGQSDEGTVMDAVEADKPQGQTQAQAQAPAQVPAQAAMMPAASPESMMATRTILSADATQEKADKQKLIYSYITPASTIQLNADRRYYFLSEQPQIYGTFNSPSVNPVFNLQPVPLVLQSRSNIAQVPDEQQSGKVATENVQKFSQIPPVMAAVEQQPVVQVKQISEQVDSVVDSGVPENRVAPVVVDNRALAVSTEPSVDVSSTVAAVIEARNNPIPIEVVKESVSVSQVVADEKSAVAIDSIQPTVEVVALKNVPSVVAEVVDQNVQASENVESVTQSV